MLVSHHTRQHTWCNTRCYNTRCCNTCCCNTHCYTLQHRSRRYSGKTRPKQKTSRKWCNTHCNTLQLTAIYCSTGAGDIPGRLARSKGPRWSDATHTATHCNSLELTATRCNTGAGDMWGGLAWSKRPRLSDATHAATHCNSLELTATQVQEIFREDSLEAKDLDEDFKIFLSNRMLQVSF